MRRHIKGLICFSILAVFLAFPACTQAAGLNNGTHELSAVNVKSGRDASAVLLAQKSATKIILVKTAKIKAGFKKTLKPKLVNKGESLTGLKWSSSNKAVATVTSKGIVTGKKAGTCKITCKLANGKKYTVKVTVQANKFSTGKTTANCSVGSYPPTYVSLELNSVYYQNGKLYTKWVALNNHGYRAVKFNHIDVDLKDGNGKSFAKRRFVNVGAGISAYGKKYITLVFPAGKFSTIDLAKTAINWNYYAFTAY